jgi:hypothetical protein
MRIDVDRKTGKTTVVLLANDKSILSQAANLLTPLSVITGGDCKESAATGAKAITEVLGHLTPDEAAAADAGKTASDQTQGGGS